MLAESLVGRRDFTRQALFTRVKGMLLLFRNFGLTELLLSIVKLNEVFESQLCFSKYLFHHGMTEVLRALVYGGLRGIAGKGSEEG